MAYTDRALIACSVSVLAITLVTFYYWRSNKKSHPKGRDFELNKQQQLTNNINQTFESPASPKSSRKLKYSQTVATGEQKTNSLINSELNPHSNIVQEDGKSIVKDSCTSSASEKNCLITENNESSLKSDINSTSILEENIEDHEMHLKNMSFNFSSKSNKCNEDLSKSVTCSKTSIIKKDEYDNNNQSSKTSDLVELELVEESDKSTKQISNEFILILNKNNSFNVEVENKTNVKDLTKKSMKEEGHIQEITKNKHSPSVIKESSSSSSIKMINNDKDLNITLEESEKCNTPNQQQWYNNKPQTSTISSIVVSDDEKKKEIRKEEIGQQICRQTFAQIVSSNNNCDSTSNNKKCDTYRLDRTKRMQQSPSITASKTNCSNENNDGNDSTLKIADGSKINPTMATTKDENEVDIYHNYPDLINTPTSEQEQVVDHNSTGDDHSQGSNDSGQGSCIDPMQIDSSSSSAANNFFKSSPTLDNVADNQAIQYNFEIPIQYCGYLIGKKGRFIIPLKMNTMTHIVIQKYTDTTNICSIFGPRSNVYNALSLIRNRFPEEYYPLINLNHVELTPTIPLPSSCQLILPVGVMAEVILSCTINAGHFFLQQPTHPTYPNLSHLDKAMKENYSQTNAPSIPQVYPGLICAAPTAEGWYRASVKYVHESKKECDLIFVDYGGHALNVPVSTLRQIHCNFMSLPFQASECLLARVVPANAQIGWTPQANAHFEELAHGRIIHAFIENYDENGIPFVNLYKQQGEMIINIGEELVKSGHAQWI